MVRKDQTCLRILQRNWPYIVSSVGDVRAVDVIPQIAVPFQSLLQSQGSQDSKETVGLTNLKQRWYSETMKFMRMVLNRLIMMA